MVAPDFWSCSLKFWFKTYLPAFKTQNTAPTTHIVAYSDNNMVSIICSLIIHSFKQADWFHWADAIRRTWRVVLVLKEKEKAPNKPLKSGQTGLNVNWYFSTELKLTESLWISVYLSVEGKNHLPYTTVYIIKPACVCVCVCNLLQKVLRKYCFLLSLAQVFSNFILG